MSAATRAMLEDLAFARDERNCEPAERPVLFLEDGSEKPLPMRWGVCPVCDGNGRHVNPSIDCNGISADEFAEDPEFAEDYFAGVYDQTCNRCQGRTTVPVVNVDALTDEERAAWERQCRADAECRAEEMAERRMGA